MAAVTAQLGCAVPATRRQPLSEGKKRPSKILLVFGDTCWIETGCGPLSAAAQAVSLCPCPFIFSDALWLDFDIAFIRAWRGSSLDAGRCGAWHLARLCCAFLNLVIPTRPLWFFLVGPISDNWPGKWMYFLRF